MIDAPDGQLIPEEGDGAVTTSQIVTGQPEVPAADHTTLRWDEVTDLVNPGALNRDANVYQATVPDGTLLAILSQDSRANLRSLSVSFRSGVLDGEGRPAAARFPTWPEMESAAAQILPTLVDPTDADTAPPSRS